MKIDITNKNHFGWSVKLNLGLDPKTVNKKNIKLIDDNGVEHPVSIRYSETTRTIHLVPDYKFQNNIEYSLMLGKNIATNSGKKLNKPLQLSFFVVGKSIVNDFVDSEKQTLNTKFDVEELQVSDLEFDNEEFPALDTDFFNDKIPISNEENTKQKESNKRKLNLLLFLLLFPFLGILSYSNQSDPRQSLDVVLAEYKWDMVVTGVYLENEGTASYSAEKVKFQKDTYYVYLINNGARCSDIRLDIYDDLSLNKLYKMVVIPREHITGKDVEFKCFKINFAKKELSEINANAVNYVTGFNFDYIE